MAQKVGVQIDHAFANQTTGINDSSRHGCIVLSMYSVLFRCCQRWSGADTSQGEMNITGRFVLPSAGWDAGAWSLLRPSTVWIGGPLPSLFQCQGSQVPSITSVPPEIASREVRTSIQVPLNAPRLDWSAGLFVTWLLSNTGKGLLHRRLVTYEVDHS